MRLDFFYFKLLYLCTIVLVVLTECRSFDLRSTARTIYKKILSRRSLPFEDCGSTYDVLYVNISSCSSIPCQMVRNSTVTVNVIFDDNGDNISLLIHRVRWIFNAIKTNAAITPDLCDDNQHCLIDETDGKSYDAQVYVNSTLPNIRGTMMWEAVNQNNVEVICFKIPIIVL
ncbi:NPC intracellular cholesterol transporter 2 [Anastrepha ludens]|uniref:NPC intracellular cholesterol transporter 2 n=1 Tax=Anastrepha ludens TaxID=28586 RepID=UPI0023B1F122|nr:NPC intracellular cholesterol transporter 2 [Anastrepha ludens]